MEGGMKLRAALILGCLVLGLSATAQQVTTEPVTGKGTKPAEKPKVQAPTRPKAANALPNTPLQDPGAVFAGLIGSCWRAPLEEGNTDTHCFTVSFNGKLVMDVHKVRNPTQVVLYEGVTVYRPDKRTRSLTYEYSNSLGNLITGQSWRTGADINSASQMGLAAKPESIWRVNADGETYDVIDPAGKGPRRHFKKTGPAPEGL
jgi:hypothetical protein